MTGMVSPIRFDCRHYLGHKPCGRSPLCAEGCAAYEPRGKRILILKLGAMGDVLRTTPLLRPLRAACDPCHITWLVDPESESLLRYNPFVHRVLAWGLDACVILQAESFDLSLNFEKEQRALALDALVRAGEKRGFALTPAGTLGIHNAASEYALRLGIDDDLKFRRNRKTMPHILSEMAELPYGREEYVLEIGPRAEEFARRFARERGLDPGRAAIGLNTGCGSVFPTKQWPASGFAALAGRLRRETKAQVLLLGGAREREFNRAVMRGSPPQALIDAGCDNTLEEFLGVVSLCDLVVTSDSMAMHAAIALKKRVAALMGATSAAEIDLYDRGEIVAAGWDCSPCYRKRCEKSPNCMDAVAPDSVFEAAIRLLNDLRGS
jgi:heptosyltransferase-2